MLLLQSCGAHSESARAVPAAKLETVHSVSPASIAAPPMARTRIQPPSVMTSIRRPQNAIHDVQWTQLPGGAQSVTASPDGSIWVLSSIGSGPDRSIWHYASGAWTNITGAAMRLAVAPDNTLWAVNSAGGIYTYVAGEWSTIAGGASDISIGSDSSVYVISNQGGGPYGRGIWRSTGGVWSQIPGAGVRIAASWDTTPYPGGITPGGFYVTTAVNGLYYYAPGSGFTQLPGAALQVAPTTSGGLFALGYLTNSDGSSPIYYNNLNTGAWKQQAGAAISIGTSGGAVYVVGAGGGIYMGNIINDTTATPTPAPTTPSFGQQNTVRAAAQAVLVAGKFLGQGGYGTGGPPLGAMGIVRAVRSRRAAQKGTPQALTCNSFTGGSNTFSSFTDAQGYHETYTDFYDEHCAQQERVATLLTPPGSSISAGSVTGDTTEYDRSHAVIGYATFSSTYDATHQTVQTAFSKSVGGPVVGRSGATCTQSSTTATTESCGLALFSTVAGTTYGVAESIPQSFATSNNGYNHTADGTVTATTYSGAGLALVPPGSGSTAWGLSGGTQLDAISGTAGASYQGSFVSSATYSLNDTTAAIGIAGSLSGSTLTITLTQSSATVATIVVDTDGNGTLTYADTTKENVAGYTIFG